MMPVGWMKQKLRPGLAGAEAAASRVLIIQRELLAGIFPPDSPYSENLPVASRLHKNYSTIHEKRG
jgi:hypothetical protein